MRFGLHAMISVEEETLEELRSAVEGKIDAVLGMLLIANGDRRQVIQILQHIAEGIQDEVTQIIVSARQKAAQAAYATVIIEAKLSEPLSEPDDNLDDEGRALAVGFSYAAAWLQAALAAVVLGMPDLKRTTKRVDYRLEAIATTEVSEAYSAAALAQYELLPDKDIFYKRWDATLDKKVCKPCEDHNGEEVPVHKEFKDGDVPGDFHPRCRCQVTLIPKSVSQAA